MTVRFSKSSMGPIAMLAIIGWSWGAPMAIAQSSNTPVSEPPPTESPAPPPPASPTQDESSPTEPASFSGGESSSSIQAAPLPAAAAYAEYSLGAGDQLFITVFGYDEFTGTWIVLPDGSISLPLIGSIIVSGQTPSTLTQYLTQRLNEHLVDPVVTIAPTVLRPVVVNVAGAVHRPGPLQLRSLSAVNRTVTATTVTSRVESTLDSVPTVTSALVEAGGITAEADIRRVVVTRSRTGQESRSITLNLWNSLWSDQVPEDLLLQDGDSIFIPTLEDGSEINPRLLAQSNLAPETVTVRVMGEVRRPGPVEVSPTSSISGAIAAAGGHTPDGRLRRVAFVRLNTDGSILQQEMDLRDLDDLDQVQEGDVIYVPKRNSAEVLDFAARLLTPFSSLLNVINRTTQILE